MKLAVIGSRTVESFDLEDNIPTGVTEIITGGARGVDALAAQYAERHNISLTIIKPDYKRYGKAAPILRNKEIVRAADFVLAVWDGSSRGTAGVIELAKKESKQCRVIIPDVDK